MAERIILRLKQAEGRSIEIEMSTLEALEKGGYVSVDWERIRKLGRYVGTEWRYLGNKC